MRGSIEISIFAPVVYERVALSIGASAIRQPPRPRSGSLARWVAALASCAIHAFLLGPLLLSSHVRLPVLKPARDPVAMELTFLEDPLGTDAVETASQSGAPTGTPELQALSTLKVPEEAREVLADLNLTNATAGPGSEAEQARLAQLRERYIGQISARIERAWIKPRAAPAGAESFSCRVRIDQNESGTVREVTLQQCDGNLPLRLSLIRAIESASPLPAASDPAVFARSIQLSFRGGFRALPLNSGNE